MCGIAGIVTRNNRQPDEGLLRRMSACIAHRGPDSEGVWSAPGVGLAHRRLAIIDLNPTGAQPMWTHDRRFVIIFNGEMYNYRELRDELMKHGAKFISSSDTEVIIEGYRAWGVDVLQKLRGMFAFALWDVQKKSLVLARDRIGKKPLFYGFTSEHDLVFASELKALAPVLEMKPDFDAVRLFLGLQYVPSPSTGFHEVMQIQPGQFGIWDETGWNISTYHEWISAPKEQENSEIDKTIRQTLDEAVKIRQLASDVPVGAFLSGGVDSAAVVALASKHLSKPLQTFTMGFPSVKMDERNEARSLAKHFKTDHHEFEAKPEDLLSCMDELVAHYDAPYADSSALPLWLLAKETAKDIKVVLTGDGGDELFGGYRRYSAYDRALGLASVPLLPHLAAPASLWMGNVFGDVRFGRMSKVVEMLKRDPAHAYGEMFCGSYFATSALHDLFNKEFLAETEGADAVRFVGAQMNGDASLDAAMRFDLTSYLPDCLNVKMDRATMRFGLEARSPFLDQQLVAFALTLTTDQKVSGGKTKIALKRALRGIVPDEVLNRPKRGFQVPLAEWFRGPLNDMLRTRLLDPQAPISQIVKTEAVARLIKKNDDGEDHGNRLWMLLTLSTWMQKYS